MWTQRPLLLIASTDETTVRRFATVCGVQSTRVSAGMQSSGALRSGPKKPVCSRTERASVPCHVPLPSHRRRECATVPCHMHSYFPTNDSFLENEFTDQRHSGPAPIQALFLNRFQATFAWGELRGIVCQINFVPPAHQRLQAPHTEPQGLKGVRHSLPRNGKHPALDGAQMDSPD